MSTTIAPASEAFTPAMTRRGHRRRRHRQSQAKSSAGREMSEDREDDVMEGGCRIISREYYLSLSDPIAVFDCSFIANTKTELENRFAFLSSTEPAPGSQAVQTAFAPLQLASPMADKGPKLTSSFAKASIKRRKLRPTKQNVPVSQAERKVPQSAFTFSHKTLDFKDPGASATTAKCRAKLPVNSAAQPLPGTNTDSSNPHLLPQFFPSIAPSIAVDLCNITPAPPSRPPDGPITPPPIPYPPASLLTPPPSPPALEPGANFSKEPLYPAKASLDSCDVSTEKGWPELKNEPMAPATKDRKSRFFPHLIPLMQFAAPANTSKYNPGDRIGMERKSKASPPSPLDLVSISLASPLDEECPLLVRADSGNDVRGASKRKASWILLGNDMSRLRLKTCGFIDRDNWAIHNGGVEEKVGMVEEYMKEMRQGEIRDMHEGESDRRWSLGEEWEIVEVE